MRERVKQTKTRRKKEFMEEMQQPPKRTNTNTGSLFPTMHLRKAPISYATRFNSTVAKGNPKRPLVDWGQSNHLSRTTCSSLNIEHRQDSPSLKLKTPSNYSPDLSYLRDSPQSSIAGKLAQTPTLADKVKALRIERMEREEKAMLLSARLKSEEKAKLELEREGTTYVL
jgi:hypothetical protein